MDRADARVLVMAALGSIIVLGSLFIPWVKFYPSQMTDRDRLIEHSMLDDGVTGWEIVTFSEEGADILTLEVRLVAIMMVCIALFLPLIVRGEWLGQVISGVITIVMDLGLILIVASKAHAEPEVSFLPLLGYYLVIIGATVMIVCGLILRNERELAKEAARDDALNNG